MTNIEWTEETWNPWHGCEPVSAGCENCYMFRDKEKYGQDGAVVTRSKTTFDDPLKKFKDPSLIFTCSWSDFFIREADEWRPDAWRVIQGTPWHQYQILTKRPQRITKCLPPPYVERGHSAKYEMQNVWLGVSVENNKALHRIRYFSRLKELSNWRFPVNFVSFEPLLERINLLELAGAWSLQPYQWAIIGGESGNDTGRWAYRPCEMDWIAELIEFHLNHGVPVFFKQTGVHLAKRFGLTTRTGTDVENLPAGLFSMPANAKEDDPAPMFAGDVFNLKQFPNFYHRWDAERRKPTRAGLFDELPV